MNNQMQDFSNQKTASCEARIQKSPQDEMSEKISSLLELNGRLRSLANRITGRHQEDEGMDCPRAERTISWLIHQSWHEIEIEIGTANDLISNIETIIFHGE